MGDRTFLTAPRFAPGGGRLSQDAPTVTGWERRIRERYDELGEDISRGRIQRLARQAHRAGIPYEGSWRWIDYLDPTGQSAVSRAARRKTPSRPARASRAGVPPTRKKEER